MCARFLMERGYNPSVAFGDSLVTLLSSSPTFPLIGESSLHKGAYPPGYLLTERRGRRSLRWFGALLKGRMISDPTVGSVDFVRTL